MPYQTKLDTFPVRAIWPAYIICSSLDRQHSVFWQTVTDVSEGADSLLCQQRQQTALFPHGTHDMTSGDV